MCVCVCVQFAYGSVKVTGYTGAARKDLPQGAGEEAPDDPVFLRCKSAGPPDAGNVLDAVLATMLSL